MFCPTLARLVLLAGAASVGCSGNGTKYIGANRATNQASHLCTAAPAAPPDSLELGAFYGKYLDASGIPVISSAAVADRALVDACDVVVRMVSLRDDVRQVMIDHQARLAIIGTGELTTELPEYSDLYSAFPNQDWDGMRGVGATLARPASSVGEENVLCLDGDKFQGQSILVQTVAYAIEALGIEPVDSTFVDRRDALWVDAKDAGRFAETFAARENDSGIYWAVGVQDWFDANREASPPDGLYNEINTREELQAYDPGLAALIAEYLPGDSWRWSCP